MGSNPIGDAYMARYANWQSDEAQTFVTVCGFDSHRRLFISKVLKALGQRRTTPHSTGWCGVFREWIVTKARETATRLAQLAEHQTVNLAVTGSIPVPHRRLITCSLKKGTDV